MSERESLLQALRQKVAAAAPGPWRWNEGSRVKGWANPDQDISYRLLESPGRAVMCHAQTWQIRSQEADYVETFDPSMLDRLLDIAEAAELVAAYHQAGGDEWWSAHSKLYQALNELGVETPMAE